MVKITFPYSSVACAKSIIHNPTTCHLYNMCEREHPICALCGTFIGSGGSLDPEPNIWNRGSWVHNAFAIEGPKCLGEPVESSTHNDELLTWHPATGFTDDQSGWGHLTLLPSMKTVNPLATCGYVYIGFHRACASIARHFVQRATAYPVESLCDIWTTLQARYSKGPDGSGSHHVPYIPTKTGRGTYIWSRESAYHLGYSTRIEWVSI